MCAAVIEKRKSALGPDQTLVLPSFPVFSNDSNDSNDSRPPTLTASPLTGYFLLLWKYTFGRIGEDWLFLALLGRFDSQTRKLGFRFEAMIPESLSRF